jgi:thiol peroxidase
MARITLKGTPITTTGDLPRIGSLAPDFTLTKTDLSEVGLGEYRGKKIILNIFPSIDTGVCAASVRRFNAEASGTDTTVVLCISADLPFAQQRFCGAEGLDRVIPLSTFRNPAFGTVYGVAIVDGALRGLLSRAIAVIGPDGTILYTEQVPEITQEPDYVKALAAVK